MLSINRSGQWAAVQPSVRVSGVWKPVQSVFVRLAGVWTAVYASVVAAKLSASAVAASGVAPGSATTGAVTCLVTGGVAPFTYQWTRVSGYIGIGPNAVSSAVTTFTGGAGAAGVYSAWYCCVVTDAAGKQATSDNVGVTINLSA